MLASFFAIAAAIASPALVGPALAHSAPAARDIASYHIREAADGGWYVGAQKELVDGEWRDPPNGRPLRLSPYWIDRYMVNSWSLDTDGAQGPIRLASGRCVDAGDAPASGTQPRIWDCTDAAPQQSWEVVAGKIKLTNYNLCLALGNGDHTVNIVLNECSLGGAAQQWYFAKDG